MNELRIQKQIITDQRVVVVDACDACAPIPLVVIAETPLPTRFTRISSATDTITEMAQGTFSSKRKISSLHDQHALALKGRHSSNEVARSCLLKKSPSRRHLVNLGEDAILSTQDRILRRANTSALLSLSTLSAETSEVR